MSVDRLIALLKDIDNQLIRCMKCGMCQAVCPLFRETLKEADVARGKLVLLQHLLKDMIEDPEGVDKRLNRCLLCGSCAYGCPSGVNILEIFLKARAVFTEYMGLSPTKKLIFKNIVSKPGVFNRIFSLASNLQPIFIKEQNSFLHTSSFRLPISSVKDRHFIPLSKKTFHCEVSPRNDEKKGDLPKVGIFVGCLVDKIFPHIGFSMLNILTHYKVPMFIPDKQICCGIPVISSGDLKDFLKIIEQNIFIYPPEEFDYLVTPCATCTSTIRKIWPMFSDKLSFSIRNRMLALSEKTIDINYFLVEILKIELQVVPATGEKIRLTYHDPCHLKKSLGIYKEPRKLILSNGDIEFVEMNEMDHCCGMGGSFNLYYYDLSQKIGRKKAENIIQTNAEIVATSCPACMMQISDVLSKYNAKIKIKHPIEIYEATLIHRK